MSLDSSIQQARVTLTVHRAESLVGLNPGGTSNPFVTATIGQQSHSTGVVTGSTNPSYEITFTFFPCSLPTILTLRVYNKAPFTEAEELLGSATLTLFSASPKLRRTVQLGHGGNVALSQKTRDGSFGSLDISYEVVMAESQPQQLTQQGAVKNDIPAFLRDDSGPSNLTSAYAAVTAAAAAAAAATTTTTVPPPPLAMQVAPGETIVAQQPPQLSQGTYQQQQQHQQQQQQQQWHQTQRSALFPPPQPPLHSGTPSVVQQQPIGAPLSGTPFGNVTIPPHVQNVNEPIVPQSSIPLASSAPPVVTPLQTLSLAVPVAVPHSVDTAKGPNTSDGMYAEATSAPPAPTGLPMHMMPPYSYGTSSSGNFGMAGQPVMHASNPTDRGDTSQRLQPLSEQTVKPTAAPTSPSQKSGFTTSTTMTPSSTQASDPSVQQQQQQDRLQQMQFPAAAPPPVTSGLSFPSGPPAVQSSQQEQEQQQPQAPPATTTTEKEDEKTKKKVRIVASPKGSAVPTCAATATSGRGGVRPMSSTDRTTRSGAASPARDKGHSLSSNGPRSSSRGRTYPGVAASATGSSTTVARGGGGGIASSHSLSGTYHHTMSGASLYHRPDDLLEAAVVGNIAVFQRLREEDPLLSRGFEHVRDYSGRTILHLAAWHGHTDVLKTLLQSFPSVPMLELRALRTLNGNTILHSAAQGGRAAVVQWLRFGHPATGMLLGLRNVRGSTATECAREAGFGDIAAMLDEA